MFRLLSGVPGGKVFPFVPAIVKGRVRDIVAFRRRQQGIEIVRSSVAREEMRKRPRGRRDP